ncbi:MAG: AAA family ATPase, partial [Anaerolineae bacterium]
MLVELTIENFAIIDHLQVSFHEGFNVLTGETGAGKSIIVEAVASVLGGRLEQDQIRAGASQASVEAVFEAAGPAGRRILPILQEHDLLDEPPAGDRCTLILRRDLRLGGRSVCRVNGRAVPLSLLQEIGQYLVDIHGQGDNT